MKYNSIGEQLIAKAKELDPNYKPDKFNDMSEALDVILNNSNSAGAERIVKVFEPTLTAVGVTTNDESQFIEVQFSAVNEIDNYIHSLVDANKTFDTSLFLKTITYETRQLRIMSQVSWINISSGDAVFVGSSILPTKSNNHLYIDIWPDSEYITLYIYFTDSATYAGYKALANVLFTTDTKLKLTIKTNE